MKLQPDWLFWPQTQKLVKAFADSGKNDELRFVGGAVRDSLLGIKAEDVDVASTLPPQLIKTLLEKTGIRVIPTGIKHGTVTALIEGKNFEITTLRRDIFCDGRHAEVTWSTDWKEDAARRDFTINALYLAADGELYDYFSGVEDAQAGNVRFIGDARMRIKEDYLRILRFFRFYAYYGKGEINKEGMVACTELSSQIAILSGERIQNEMLKLLAAPAIFKTIELMQKAGVLEQVCGFKAVLRNPNFIVGNGIINLALLLISAEIVPERALSIIADRWRLSGELRKFLSMLIIYNPKISSASSIAQQKSLLRKLGAGNFAALVQLKQALEPEENYNAMLELVQNWQIPEMPVNGADLLKLGFKQGQELGKKLQELEKIWEESDYKLSKAELIKGFPNN